MYSKFNFHKHTFCIFREVFVDDIKDLKQNFKSKSGSIYYFTEKGVFRISNHWGRASNCRWKLESKSSGKINNNLNRIGYANWSDFYPNNELEKLFYIEVNFETKAVDFQHKWNPSYNEKFICRNASDTAKVIKTIKMILQETTWANYLEYSNFEELQQNIINELLTTNNSFITIKKKYLKL